MGRWNLKIIGAAVGGLLGFIVSSFVASNYYLVLDSPFLSFLLIPSQIISIILLFTDTCHMWTMCSVGMMLGGLFDIIAFAALGFFIGWLINKNAQKTK